MTHRAVPIIGILLTGFLVSVTAQGSRQLDSLLSSLDTLSISVLVQSSDGSVLYSHNAARPVIAASTIKVPVLMALFDRFGTIEGDLILTPHRLMAGDKAGGAGTLQFEPEGTVVTCEEMAHLMITQSDNTATNLLLSRMGMDTIQLCINKMGLKHTRLRRRMMDIEGIQKGIQNITSAEDCNHLLLDLYNRARRGSRGAERMLQLLHACDDRDVMPAGLPSGTSIAHKSGLLDKMRGDTGIIFMEKPLFVSIFVEGCSSTSRAESIIAQTTGLICRIFGVKATL